MLIEIEGTKREHLWGYGRDYICDICKSKVFLPDSVNAYCLCFQNDHLVEKLKKTTNEEV